MAQRRSSHREMATNLLSSLSHMDEVGLDPTLRQHERTRSEFSAFLELLEKRSRFRPPRSHKVHPASTTFGPSTLSAFLQDELERENASEGHPQSGHSRSERVEAEKKDLREKVNGPSPIYCDVRDGRLAVSARPRSGRYITRPASTATLGHVPPRVHGFARTSLDINEPHQRCRTRQSTDSTAQRPGHAPSQSKDLSEAISRGTFETRDPSLSPGQATPNSRVDMNGTMTLNSSRIRTRLTRRMNTTEFGHDLLQDDDDADDDDDDNEDEGEDVEDEDEDEVENEGEEGYHQDEEFNANIGNSPRNYNDRATCDIISDFSSPSRRASAADDRLHSYSPSASTDLDRIVSGTPQSSSVGRRSLSFEKHANEFRQTARESHEDVSPISRRSENDKNREKPVELRNRKSVSRDHRNTPNPVGSVFTASSSMFDSIDTSSTTNQDKTFGHGVPVRDGTLVEMDLSSVPNTTLSPLVRTHRNPSPRPLQPRENMSSTLSANATRTRQSLVGHDTFYSGSSDNEDADDDQDDELLSISSGHDRVTKGKAVHPYQDIDSSRHADSVLDYNVIVPENVPADISQARENAKRVWKAVGLDSQGQPDASKCDLWHSTQYTIEELNPFAQNILGVPDRLGYYPRKWNAQPPPAEIVYVPLFSKECRWDELPQEIWPLICRYLSSNDVQNLRLVNRATAEAILPIMTRSLVVKFGRSMFGSGVDQLWENGLDTLPHDSMFRTCGNNINKFGISFELDEIDLATVEPKEIEREIPAWFGTYTWPTEKYPRFSVLKEMEDLVDNNRPLLKNAMKSLANVSELALSVDSGHGWLTGPDISDLALFKKRQEGGSKVFGKTFDTPDKWHEYGLRQYFEWGQMNSINAYTKHIEQSEGKGAAMLDQLNFLRRLQVRHYDDYKIQRLQPDFNRYAHTGGVVSAVHQQAGAAQAGAVPQMWPGQAGAQIAHNHPILAAGNHWTIQNGPQIAPPNVFQPPQHQNQQGRIRQLPSVLPPTEAERRRNDPLMPQWPLIFNCYNLASQVGGNRPFMQEQIAQPSSFGYVPGELNEAQVQWLMETVWAQRAFLSAYTNSIISSRAVFRHVHSLHIAKLSSGLIPSISQLEFWSSLPGLRKLTLKVSPDWRREHVPGDKFFFRNMPISPVDASVKLADLLRNFIAPLEKLSVLSVGFVGGGEHQVGMFARNNHVLPAPITRDPRAWLMNHERNPDASTMLVFNHITELRFENCWFSPHMLEQFMRKSRDTSLHHLILDSVSLTGVHDTRTDGPLTTINNHLRCDFSPGEWLHETIPSSACWVHVLDNITPSRTIQDRKYDADMIDQELEPRPELEFRGNVETITLNSCGYVRISGIRSEQFSQNGLVEHCNPWLSSDEGLEARRKLFYTNNHRESGMGPTATSISERRQTLHPPPPSFSSVLRPLSSTTPTNIPPTATTPSSSSASSSTKDSPVSCIMMNARDPESRNCWFGLGKLTQCVHPVEKRVLERAWDMRFGWGDTMDRWASVEDGFYEGGTGRFSGVILRDSDQ